MSIDREQLKGTGRQGRSRRGGQPATQASAALGPAAAALVVGGREFTPGPLNFGDAKRIEARFGSLERLQEAIQAFSLDALGFVIWLGLRKSAPDLTEAELDELLPAKLEELLPILMAVLQASGLQPSEGEPGNAETPVTSP